MITPKSQVRRAVSTDHSSISDLIFSAPQTHRHMDWRAPLEWLGEPHYFVLEENERIVAALACPQDPPDAAWIRLFSYTAPLSGAQAWSALWEVIHADIANSGGATVAVICTHSWLESLLHNSRFTLKQHIVMLSLQTRSHKPAATNIHIRPITYDDLSVIVQVDWSAFEPLWRNSTEATQSALSQSNYATLAELDGQVLGYQLSTQNPRGSHLARLSVKKEAQGKGIASALLSDMIHHFNICGVDYFSVNTQADNSASLSLYKKFGYLGTGEQYPVYIYEIKGRQND